MKWLKPLALLALLLCCVVIQAGCGRSLGAIPDLPFPVILPHPKLHSARSVYDPVTGKDAIIMSLDDAEKIPADQAARDGEVRKVIEGMRSYKGMLKDCVRR
jgi:hypothetical protein